MPSLSLHALSQEVTAAFTHAWPTDVVQPLTRDFLCWLLNTDPAWLIAHQDAPISPEINERFQALLPRIHAQEPLAHLIGSALFYGRSFQVTPATLIPRPETEGLVDLVLSRWPKQAFQTLVVDMGTGSGCIGITLAHTRSSRAIILTDVQADALTIAQQNADTLLESDADYLTWLQTPLFSDDLQAVIIKRMPKRLIIAANLPYLPESDQQTLTPNVTQHEPASALFGGATGDELIRELLTQVQTFQTQYAHITCELVLEFDPPQAASLKAFAETLFPHKKSTLVNDVFGRARFLLITAP